MIRIVLFASIREALDCHQLELALDGEWRISDLIERLTVDHGDQWRQELTAENVRIAINQEVITGNPVIEDGDEIAFFPPVTGG